MYRDNAITRRMDEVAEGSLHDVAAKRNITIDEAIAGADVVAMIDVSGSMSERTTQGQTKWDAATEQLKKIQKTFPGRVLLIDFSGDAKLRLKGVPRPAGGGTNMSEALALAHDFDGLDTTFFLISDGMPNNEDTVFDWAVSFEDSINTIFIGSDFDTRGLEVMNKVAMLSGGTQSGQIEPEMLGQAVTKLLTAG